MLSVYRFLSQHTKKKGEENPLDFDRRAFINKNFIIFLDSLEKEPNLISISCIKGRNNKKYMESRFYVCILPGTKYDKERFEFGLRLK